MENAPMSGPLGLSPLYSPCFITAPSGCWLSTDLRIHRVLLYLDFGLVIPSFFNPLPTQFLFFVFDKNLDHSLEEILSYSQHIL